MSVHFLNPMELKSNPKSTGMDYNPDAAMHSIRIGRRSAWKS